MTTFPFEIKAREGKARTGVLKTPRGDIRTPAFMPVGTAGTVKALYMDQVKGAGADIIYCSGLVPETFGALSRQHFPCCGHVGYLPVNDTWLGGPRAVGKTAEEAKKIFDDVMALEANGCIAVEMECVPAKVAAEITKRTKLLVFSMGSGPDGDGQFIFAEDLLGTNSGHYPRHAITYSHMYDEAVKAFTSSTMSTSRSAPAPSVL